jgi:hypothetical protein
LKPQKVDPKIAREYAEKNHMLFIETSAKDGQNVQDAFCNLTRVILKQTRHNEQLKFDADVKSLKDKNPKKQDTCCIMM